MDISDELREKAKACRTPEEILALAKSEDYKLSEAELEVVSGGFAPWTSDTEKQECVNCGKKYDIELDACPSCGFEAPYFDPEFT